MLFHTMMSGDMLCGIGLGKSPDCTESTSLLQSGGAEKSVGSAIALASSAVAGTL